MAHPRSRGENPHLGYVEVYAQGSSPLTRGKRRADRRVFRRRGLIPAHAGKTAPGPDTAGMPGAHPRSRGENEKDPYSDETLSGSSPLTRGKPIDGSRIKAGTGLIPAHAGKTMRLSQQGLITRAHPRSRGENRGGDLLRDVREGSSPLTRGKRLGDLAALDRQRLIPAHAGKTSTHDRKRSSLEAHPRSRGENLQIQVDGNLSDRLIPAHAGKTAVPLARRRYTRAHPRSRGENRVLRGVALVVGGSSPLTRGKPLQGSG